MANQSQKGFWPLDQNPDQELRFIVDAANGTAIFPGDLVSAVAAGAVNAAVAADANIVVGSVLAIYDSDGIPAGHPNSSLANKRLPASTAGLVLVALALPGRRFRCQSATALTVAALMASSDHVAGAGNTTLNTSGHTLNGGDLNTGGQCFIVDLYQDPGNAYGANQSLVVIFNESLWMGTGKAVGV